MPEPAAPHPSTTTTRPPPSPNGTAPPVPSEATPSEATKAPARMRWSAALDRFRPVMTPLRRMMRKAGRHE
jgi:hypothetical protein